MDYSDRLNPTALGLKPSGIRKFFDITEHMENVISLGVGEPDFQTPWHIRHAGISSLENGKTRYTANRGIEALRQEISKYMKRRYSLAYSVDEVLVTVGGSEAIDLAVRALVRPGDEVLVPQPSFVCYEPIVQLAGGVPIPVQLSADNAFVLTPEQMEDKITEKTKVLILPYPCNPTGAVLHRPDLEKIAAFVRRHDLMVISDEIYAELIYTGTRNISIAEMDGMWERTVIASGFSKTYSMTGWRLGYAVAPAPIISLMTKIHQFAIMSAPTTSQYAAIDALQNGDEDIARMVQEYDMRRRIIVNGFRKIGLDCFEPLGAFYVFPCIKSTGLTSEEFCEQLLFSKNVAMVPGSAFGVGGEGFIRASYCYSLAHIKEALSRTGEFVQECKEKQK